MGFRISKKDYTELSIWIETESLYVINIANVSSFNNLEDATVTIAKQEGFVHEDTYRLALSKIRGNGFKYEPIFVFRKR